MEFFGENLLRNDKCFEYEFDIFDFISDIDECSKPNRCGQGASCLNKAGGFECVCPEGSIPDPDPSIRCITVVTCKSNNDCPGNAICDEHQRCLCPTPNIGNDCRHPCENLACGNVVFFCVLCL